MTTRCSQIWYGAALQSRRAAVPASTARHRCSSKHRLGSASSATSDMNSACRSRSAAPPRTCPMTAGSHSCITCSAPVPCTSSTCTSHTLCRWQKIRARPGSTLWFSISGTRSSCSQKAPTPRSVRSARQPPPAASCSRSMHAARGSGICVRTRCPFSFLPACKHRPRREHALRRTA